MSFEQTRKVIHKTQSFTNPASNPIIDLDVGGKRQVEVYARSIGASKTVWVRGSVDRVNWRLSDTLTTAAAAPYEVHKGYLNAYRFIQLELNETGTGTSVLEISASGE